jgi:hypothetical protein
MILLSGKPSIPTELLPQEIIGYKNMAEFTNHMRIALKRVDGDWPGKELSKLGSGVRNMVAEALNRLWENGFVVAGLGKNGNVQFGCRLRSSTDDIFEGPELEKMKRMSERELQELGRNGFIKLSQAVEQF